MGEAEEVEFLSALATVDHVSASTQNQALGASCSCTARCLASAWIGWRGVTVLPVRIADALVAHLLKVRALHERDVAGGGGWVALPDALSRKFVNAGREWRWQWVFPATRTYVDLETGQRKRHHLHETVLQRAVKPAVRGRPDEGRNVSHTTARTS